MFLKNRGEIIKEYKVMLFTIKIDRGFIQNFEVSLNQMAADGWVLKHSNFRGKAYLLPVMERNR